MDHMIHLELSEEEMEYLATTGLEPIITLALENVAKTRPLAPILSLIQEIQDQHTTPDDALVEGYPVSCNPNVSLGVGPVIGEVTHDMAIVAIEVLEAKGEAVDVTCDLYKLVTS